MRVETFRVKRNVKDYLSVIIGAILMIVGFILLIKFIIEFIVLFIGIILFGVGFYLVWTHKYIKNLRFFRF